MLEKLLFLVIKPLLIIHHSSSDSLCGSLATGKYACVRYITVFTQFKYSTVTAPNSRTVGVIEYGSQETFQVFYNNYPGE